MTILRIAVVRDLEGHSTCIGPDDFQPGDYSDQMEAAICFHIEAGRTPADKRWVSVDLPNVASSIPEHEGFPDER